MQLFRCALVALVFACDSPPVDPPPPPMPDGGPIGRVECDMPEVLARNRCTSSGCHGDRYQANLDLLSPGIEERLATAVSNTMSCRGQPLIDDEDPSQSLLLRVTDAELHASTASCGAIMPYGTSTGVTGPDLDCMREWVGDIAEIADPIDYGDQFVASTPVEYVPRIKRILTGEAATAAEVDAVISDEAQLRTLVTEWMTRPGFERAMRGFLLNSLQQEFRTPYSELFGPGAMRGTALADSLTESFVRTAQEIVASDRPFTEVVTTKRWWVNTAVLAFLTYYEQTEAAREQTHDIATVADDGDGVFDVTRDGRSWTMEIPPDCRLRPLPQPRMMVGLFGRFRCRGAPDFFPPIGTGADHPLIVASDYEDWRVVELEVTGDAPIFYNLPALRRVSGTLPIRAPKVGFFGAPAFHATWLTNDDNEFRVTINQTMISALGATFSLGDATDPIAEGSIDREHTDGGEGCIGCHRHLDPMRPFFGRARDTSYFPGAYPGPTEAGFAMLGQRTSGSTVEDLANAIATHPRFPMAWAQKVCTFATSQPCDENDPELVAIAERFAAGFSLKNLVLDVFTSNIVTEAELTANYSTRAQLVSVARRRQLCNTLESRLGENYCLGSDADALVPDDSYSRGRVDAVLATESSAFHFAALEQLCVDVAREAVQRPGAPFAGDPAVVVPRIVHELMGLYPGHPREPAALAALTQHVSTLEAEGARTELAVASAFVVACISPDIAGVGL